MLTDAVDVDLAALDAVNVEDVAALAVRCLLPSDALEVGGCPDSVGREVADESLADAVHLA
ncbi:hypothetical protein [Streptomyces coelicoflavus]|uniref:hypothetical protein n=1 Tax=Streptomyces coelicoflavus TaxID=285562 RepID=UPI00225BDF15|nr:hypothetical protein [Streptomyces coelicoflavus]MCX5040596.1 hypothetical protein [Streptomyces coelicoflavus]